MKKCADCKHKGQTWTDKEQCARKGKVTDPRTGFEEDPPYCSCERDAPRPICWILGTCGRAGRFFEPKEQEMVCDLTAEVKRNVSRDRQKRILRMLEEAALEEPEKAPVLRKIKGEIRDLFKNIGDALGK